MVAFFGLAQQVTGSALNRLDPEVEEDLEHLAQGEQHRLAVHQRQHVGTEIALQWRELEQVVQHHLGIGIPAQFDDDPHAVAVGFVANVGNPLELLVVHQLGNALDQRGLVGLIGQLRDDHSVAIGAPLGLDRLNRGHAAHRDGTAAGFVHLPNPAPPQDLTAGGEVRSLDDGGQLTIADFGVGDQREQAINQLGEVVGRNVGGHAHRDPRRAIQQQLRDARRHHRWFLLGAIEVVDEIDGFALDVLQQAVGRQRPQPRFGVSHGGRRIVIHRTEVAVAVDERHAHGKVLRHAHQRVVDGGITVGVVLTEHLTHHTGALSIGPITRQAQLVHGVQDPPVHGFQTIAGIGQRPSHDHAHRVLQIGARHLVAKVSLNNSAVGSAWSFSVPRGQLTGFGWIRHS